LHREDSLMVGTADNGYQWNLRAPRSEGGPPIQVCWAAQHSLRSSTPIPYEFCCFMAMGLPVYTTSTKCTSALYG
jgi:hypothetical protein